MNNLFPLPSPKSCYLPPPPLGLLTAPLTAFFPLQFSIHDLAFNLLNYNTEKMTLSVSQILESAQSRTLTGITVWINLNKKKWKCEDKDGRVGKYGCPQVTSWRNIRRQSWLSRLFWEYSWMWHLLRKEGALLTAELVRTLQRPLLILPKALELAWPCSMAHI